MTISLIDLIYKGETLTGEAFNNAIIVSAWSRDCKYKILYDTSGNFITDKYLIDAISTFFNLSFELGFMDGCECFINTEK